MDRERRQRLLREAVLRAAREFHAHTYEEERVVERDVEPTASTAVLERPRRTPVPDTLRELVES